MNKIIFDWKKYSSIARSAAAEGCVLLRNEKQTLPIRPGETVAVFGRIQFDYYKSGTGSGGMVNVPYVRSILDGLELYPEIHIYEPLRAHYLTWMKEHPFDYGNGWGTEPWCQEEMKITDEIVADAAAHSDLALVIIGRTAGEDRDNMPVPGSYYLTETEKDMLKKVCGSFSRTAVILNVGNIIDMNWVDEYTPEAVLYVWQGGMEGGYGAADILSGAVTPSGKLPDTIARKLSDYPSSGNFGSDSQNLYQEDIYVGYRYFETFAPDCVQYPFGFGLSYTEFSITSSLQKEEQQFAVIAQVTNTGTVAGKEVVQVYVCPPQGCLGKPKRNLVGFAKTKTLYPGEKQTVTIPITPESMASYDDSGLSGCKSCFVLEAGIYEIYTGSDVRNATLTDIFSIDETRIVSRHQEVLTPVIEFERYRPVKAEKYCAAEEAVQTETRELSCSENNVQMRLAYEPVPVRTVAIGKYLREQTLSCLPYIGDQGYKLKDVADGTITMEQFLTQLSDDDLMMLVKGEGMCSPKVTPGTAAAYGGISESLHSFGIPALCCADGPSGIRMDCGSSAFSLPNGTLLASTFNPQLVTELFEMEGLELYSNGIDTLLGPGINIHRSPLNGRNFEYHSEDPYLTGRMAQAQLLGLDRWGVSGTMKHFCANNQEHCRHLTNSVVSERALREIYLRPFEMAVRNGVSRSVMTSYGPVNGIWTAGNYELNTKILREEWGFHGVVMTDWWAKVNDEKSAPSCYNLAAMVRAQNDVYMVTADPAGYEDNLQSELEQQKLTRAELVRCAENICDFALHTPAMKRIMGTYLPVKHVNQPENSVLLNGQIMESHSITENTMISMENYPASGGTSFILSLTFEKEGTYSFSLTVSSDVSELAQMAVSISLDSTVLKVYSFHGSEKNPVTQSAEKEIRGKTHYLKVYITQSGLKLHSLQIQKLES